MKKFTVIAVAAVVAALAWATVPVLVQAQGPVPSAVGPYNIDLGALITNVAQGNGTVNSAAQANLDQSGVVCVMKQSAVSGTPSTVFGIQSYDAATASWNTLVSSGAITTSTANLYSLWIRPGLIAADVPSNGVGKSTALPRAWRVTETVTASGDTTTSKIGCNLLK